RWTEMCDPSLHRSQQGIVKASSLCGCGALPRHYGTEPRHHTMQSLKPFDPFGGHPIALARHFRHKGAILLLQSIEECLPADGKPRLVFLRSENRELRTG